MEGMAQTDVLVVGAGPTGLTLACDLVRRGVAVRIVDRASEFPGGSRGKGLSPRSLEVFDDLAVIDRMLASGITHMPHRKYRGAEVIAEIDPEAGQVPTPDIPYPTGLMMPQCRCEHLLNTRRCLLPQVFSPIDRPLGRAADYDGSRPPGAHISKQLWMIERLMRWSAVSCIYP